jgi:hypothetical protein
LLCVSFFPLLLLFHHNLVCVSFFFPQSPSITRQDYACWFQLWHSSSSSQSSR